TVLQRGDQSHIVPLSNAVFAGGVVVYGRRSNGRIADDAALFVERVAVLYGPIGSERLDDFLVEVELGLQLDTFRSLQGVNFPSDIFRCFAPVHIAIADVIAEARDVRPTEVAAGLDRVQLIVTARTMLNGIKNA